MHILPGIGSQIGLCGRHRASGQVKPEPRQKGVTCNPTYEVVDRNNSTIPYTVYDE